MTVEMTANLHLAGLLVPLSPYLPVTGMLAPTHVLFGLLAASLIGLLAGLQLSPLAYTFAVVGALLPDLDTTASLVGRLVYPLAWFIERRFGHRGPTHSLVGLFIVALLTSPLLVHPGLVTAYLSVLIGYASHLVADSMNKSGVPLFWPATYQAVLPGNQRYRLRAGSPAELGLALALLPFLALSIPLNHMSLTTALHAVIRNVNSAVQDYQAWAGQHLVWVELEGRHNLSQKPVRGVFEAIGTAGQNAIVIRDGQGDIYAAGNSRDDQIYVHRIRAVKGIPIRTEIQEVRLADQPLGDLFTWFPQACPEPFGFAQDMPCRREEPLELWIEGWFVTPGRPVLIDDAGEFNRSKRAQGVAGEGLFEIRYFTPADLALLQDLYVTRAHFILRAVYRSPGTAAQFGGR